jgi:HTH-type transcriptional regulator / antitoxin MqsA
VNINHCPACGSSQLGLASQPETVEFKGLHVYVQDVLSTTCSNCGYTFATPAQHDRNVAAARVAYLNQRAAAKEAKGLLSGTQLRAMREALGLSQKDAAELFGGGPVAFSKYENESVAQSVAMDRLVRVVHHMGKFGVQTLREALVKPVAVEAVEAKSSHLSSSVVIFEVSTEKPYQVATQVAPLPASGPAFEFPLQSRLWH